MFISGAFNDDDITSPTEVSPCGLPQNKTGNSCVSASFTYSTSLSCVISALH